MIPETTPELLEVSKRHHNFGTKHFKEKSLFIFHASIALKSLILLFVYTPDCARCQNRENTHTDTQTDRHTDRTSTVILAHERRGLTSTVTLAHARRGLIMLCKNNKYYAATILYSKYRRRGYY